MTPETLQVYRERHHILEQGCPQTLTIWTYGLHTSGGPHWPSSSSILSHGKRNLHAHSGPYLPFWITLWIPGSPDHLPQTPWACIREGLVCINSLGLFSWVGCAASVCILISHTKAMASSWEVSGMWTVGWGCPHVCSQVPQGTGLNQEGSKWQVGSRRPSSGPQNF